MTEPGKAAAEGLRLANEAIQGVAQMIRDSYSECPRCGGDYLPPDPCVWCAVEAGLPKRRRRDR